MIELFWMALGGVVALVLRKMIIKGAQTFNEEEVEMKDPDGEILDPDFEYEENLEQQALLEYKEKEINK